MPRSARQSLQKLLGQRPSFPPPVADADEDLDALRQDLARWHADSATRYARFFLRDQPLLVGRRERDLFRRLETLGLAVRVAPSIYLPCVRLFPLYGRFLATDLHSFRERTQVFSLMFEQVYLIRNMDVRPADEVLELCLGSGVNALFAADVARHVTGVDVNPRALAFARFNERLNPAAVPLTLCLGSLFEPIPSDRRFDAILVNPPFELVPPGETAFLHSDGGEDGLDVVRALLRDAPRHLAPRGRLQMITWSPGTEREPLLVDLLREALPAHRLRVHVLDKQPLEPHLATFSSNPACDAWRAALSARSLTHLWFVFVHAGHDRTPGVEMTTPQAEIAACDEIADAWWRAP